MVHIPFNIISINYVCTEYVYAMNYTHVYMHYIRALQYPMSIIGPPQKKYQPSVSDSKPLLQYSFSVLYNVYNIYNTIITLKQFGHGASNEL